jgi:hypothetical protein
MPAGEDRPHARGVSLGLRQQEVEGEDEDEPVVEAFKRQRISSVTACEGPVPEEQLGAAAKRGGGVEICPLSPPNGIASPRWELCHTVWIQRMGLLI